MPSQLHRRIVRAWRILQQGRLGPLNSPKPGRARLRTSDVDGKPGPRWLDVPADKRRRPGAPCSIKIEPSESEGNLRMSREFAPPLFEERFDTVAILGVSCVMAPGVEMLCAYAVDCGKPCLSDDDAKFTKPPGWTSQRMGKDQTGWALHRFRSRRVLISAPALPSLLIRAPTRVVGARNGRQARPY